MAASILKEAMMTEKAVAEIAAKFATANIRVDSSALEVVDQLNFRVDMHGFLANVVESQVNGALRIFCARKVFACHVL
jgi:hypothetical protein